MNKLMFSGTNLAYWLFSVCFATGIGLIFFSLERMRVRLNQISAFEERVPALPLRARSLEELVFKTNVLAHYLGLMERYRHLHPSSGLRKMIVLGATLLVLSLVGIFACGLLG